jgi:Cu2+-exporting ATPase
MQEASVSKNRARLLRADPLLQTVRIHHEGGVLSQPVTAIVRGQEISLPPAGVVPVNAELISPRADLSLEWINGEAEPRTWEAGAVIPAGAVSLGREEIRLRAREDWSDSLLARLSAPSPAETIDPAARWLDRLMRVYLLSVLLLAVAGGAGWWWRTAEWPRALQVFISVLVVSCPCALGVAVPMAHELAVARLRRMGLFVRRADVWGRLRHVRRLVFDKTGTLTLETPQLKDPDRLKELPTPAREALRHLVQDSRHPLASSLRQSLAAYCRSRPPAHGLSAPVHDVPGLGVYFTGPSGALWSLGRPDWRPAPFARSTSIPTPGMAASLTPPGGNTGPPPTLGADTLLCCDGVAVAAFTFGEEARPDAADELARFRRQGFALDILSGDRPDKVQALALALGIPSAHAHARLSPEEKARWITSHTPDALFLGDGANDSLAFDAALVRGTPAVERGLLAEKADFYFLSRGLRPVGALFEIARLRRRAVRAAFLFALGYNILVVAFSLAGYMSPLLAAILMPLSSAVTLLIVSVHFRGLSSPLAAT